MMETGTADTILYSGSFNPIHRGTLGRSRTGIAGFSGE